MNLPRVRARGRLAPSLEHAVREHPVAPRGGNHQAERAEQRQQRHEVQNLGNGDYQFNWATPKAYAYSCRSVGFDLGEGTGQEHSALFKFSK